MNALRIFGSIILFLGALFWLMLALWGFACDILNPPSSASGWKGVGLMVGSISLALSLGLGAFGWLLWPKQPKATPHIPVTSPAQQPPSDKTTL